MMLLIMIIILGEILVWNNNFTRFAYYKKVGQILIWCAIVCLILGIIAVAAKRSGI